MEKFTQKIIHAMSGLDRGDHQVIGIDAGKVQAVASVMRQLRKKDTLRATVAFPERVQLIRPLVKIHKSREKRLLVHSA